VDFGCLGEPQWLCLRGDSALAGRKRQLVTVSLPFVGSKPRGGKTHSKMFNKNRVALLAFALPPAQLLCGQGP
jgi:hypothetical protein